MSLNNFPQSMDKSGGSGASEKSFHIDALKSKFRDLARPNQFKIKITPPPIIANDFNGTAEMLVKSASFPSMEIDEFPFERAGLILHLPTNKINYGELSVIFWNDVDFNIRTLFNAWQKLTIFDNENTNIPMNALDGEISIFQFDSYHNETYAVKAINCWPKNISEIQLSHENESQAEDFTVNFVYTNIEIYKNNI